MTDEAATNREREARRSLDRVARDSETLGTSSLARIGRRIGDHFAGTGPAAVAGDEPPDAAEIWGRRVGRALGVILGILLAWWLGAQLGWW